MDAVHRKSQGLYRRFLIQDPAAVNEILSSVLTETQNRKRSKIKIRSVKMFVLTECGKTKSLALTRTRNTSMHGA